MLVKRKKTWYNNVNIAWEVPEVAERMNVRHVAELAEAAHVRRFVITHLNPAIDPATLLKEARSVRLDAALTAIGDVYEV